MISSTFFQEMFTNEKCTFCEYLFCDQSIYCTQTHGFCHIAKPGMCCICLDKRDHKKFCYSYEGYTDGIGYTSNKSRWNYYCPFCKDFCENKHKRKN